MCQIFVEGTHMRTWQATRAALFTFVVVYIFARALVDALCSPHSREMPTPGDIGGLLLGAVAGFAEFRLTRRRREPVLTTIPSLKDKLITVWLMVLSTVALCFCLFKPLRVGDPVYSHGEHDLRSIIVTWLMVTILFTYSWERFWTLFLRGVWKQNRGQPLGQPRICGEEKTEDSQPSR